MLGSEAHFRSTLGFARATTLLAGLEASADRARQLVAKEGFGLGRTQPTIAFDLATSALETGFDAVPGVHKAVVKQQVLWIIDGTYALRVKKLRSSYRPANHDSEQQRALLGQRLECDGMTELVYLTAGVRYSERTGLPADCVVVKHYPALRRHVVEWVVNLRDLAGNGEPGTPVIPMAPVAPVAPAAIVSRRRKRSRDGTSEN